MTSHSSSGRIERSTWRLAAVVVVGAFASALDSSLANVGLNTIGRDLQADLGEVQWVSTAYLIALAMALPISSWLGRRIGVGTLWLAALAAFTVASGLCAVAPTIRILVGVRVLQGLAGGLLIPAGQTVLGHAVGPQRLGRVMASLGVVVTLGPALGPVIGGLMLTSWSWRWLFAVNLPIGIIALCLGRAIVPRGRPRVEGRLDWRGVGYVSFGLPALLYALIRSGSGAPLWSSVSWLIVGLICCTGFVVRSLRHEHALLDLRLHGRPAFSAASAASFVGGALLFGTSLLFPLYFQLLRHDSILETGLRLLPMSAATAVALPVVGRLIDRHGGGGVAVLGSALAIVASVPFVLVTASTSELMIQALLVALGIAVAFAVVPPGIVAYTSVTPDELSDAAAQVNILQRIGGALGGAVFAVVIARELPNGADAAFHAAAMPLTGISVASCVTATWLWMTRSAATRVESGIQESSRP